MGSSIAKTSIQIGGDASELEATVKRAGESLRSMVTKTAALIGTALSVKWGLDLVKGAEAAQMSMKAVLGSADTARNALKGLREQFGDEAKNFSDGFKRLALAGVDLEDIPTILKTVGEAASALTPENLRGGVDEIVGQLVTMKETAHITEKQLKSLGSLGVNGIEILRKANGYSTVNELKEALDKNLISSSTGIKQLLVGMDEKFKGAFQERQENHIGELLEDVGDRASQGMKAFATGVIENSGLKQWIKSLTDEMAALEVIGKQAGAGLGDAFRIVSNVFEGIYQVAKTFAEILSEAFGGMTKTGLGGFLAETAKLKLDLKAIKGFVIDFAEAASMGFAKVGDFISKYLIDPMAAFIGMALGAVGELLKVLGKIQKLLPDASNTRVVEMNEAELKLLNSGKHKEAIDALDARFKAGGAKLVAPGIEKNDFEGMGASLDAAGKKLFDRAVRDFNAGDVMADRAKAFFAALRSKQAASTDDLAATIASKLGIEAVAGGANPLGKLAYDKPIDKINLATAAEAAKAILPTYSPNSVLAAGSQEAQRTVMENRLGGKGPDETLKQQLVEQRKLTRLSEDVKNILNKNTVSIVMGAI